MSKHENYKCTRKKERFHGTRICDYGAQGTHLKDGKQVFYERYDKKNLGKCVKVVSWEVEKLVSW
jgi:hypothetical protein